MSIFEILFWAMVILIFEFCKIPQLLQVGTFGVDDWCVVIKNPGEMCCWNDQGHRVCDQDFGTKTDPIMFLISSTNAEEAL